VLTFQLQVVTANRRYFLKIKKEQVSRGEGWRKLKDGKDS
jgi:hypothetical protein